jgi:hypothetical protein
MKESSEAIFKTNKLWLSETKQILNRGNIEATTGKTIQNHNRLSAPRANDIDYNIIGSVPPTNIT